MTPQAKEGNVVEMFGRGRDLLSYEQTAQRLCVSKRTVEALKASGELAPVKIGRRVCFDPAEIERFKRRHTERATG